MSAPIPPTPARLMADTLDLAHRILAADAEPEPCEYCGGRVRRQPPAWNEVGTKCWDRPDVCTDCNRERTS